MKSSVYHVLIIDDEFLARELVKNFLTGYPDFEVVGEADNGFDGLKLIDELKPDLVFLDVQMPKISGMEMLDLIRENRPYIIFSTAFDQFAVKAFEKNALDYLLKPYNKERFGKSIQRFLSGVTQPLISEPGHPPMNPVEFTGKCMDRILVRFGSRVLVIPVKEIVYFQAEDDYVALHTGGKKYLKQATMKYFEDNLPKNNFVRIHRSFIINTDFLMQLEYFDRTTYMAVMKNQEKLPVSRSGSAKLKNFLG